MKAGDRNEVRFSETREPRALHFMKGLTHE